MPTRTRKKKNQNGINFSRERYQMRKVRKRNLWQVLEGVREKK